MSLISNSNGELATHDIMILSSTQVIIAVIWNHCTIKVCDKYKRGTKSGQLECGWKPGPWRSLSSFSVRSIRVVGSVTKTCHARSRRDTWGVRKVVTGQTSRDGRWEERLILIRSRHDGRNNNNSTAEITTIMKGHRVRWRVGPALTCLLRKT